MVMCMKVLSFGSVNIDQIFNLDHFPYVGESLAANEYSIVAGGKGLNQTIAAARAGLPVFFGGMIGLDGDIIRNVLKSEPNVNVSNLLVVDSVKTGTAVIQVNQNGENSIIVYGGSNQQISPANIDRVLDSFSSGDVLIMQNEISHTEYLLKAAYKKGMTIFFTPAPFSSELTTMDAVQYASWLLLNEGEGAMLSGVEGEPALICKALAAKFQNTKIVLTLGAKGSLCYDGQDLIAQRAYKVKAIDTTAAGDTFAGFFISRLLAGDSINTSLDFASRASAICVTRPGASPSIPTYEEIQNGILK